VHFCGKLDCNSNETQTEECDATAYPNNETEPGDPCADPKYSLSDDSYSDTSDIKSSLDEVNVSVLNEQQNIRGRTIKFANSPPCVCRGSTEQKT